jgi:hypothetical protein
MASLNVLMSKFVLENIKFRLVFKFKNIDQKIYQLQHYLEKYLMHLFLDHYVLEEPLLDELK